MSRFSLLCLLPVQTVLWCISHGKLMFAVHVDTAVGNRRGYGHRLDPVADAISNVNISASARDFVNSLLFCTEGPNNFYYLFVVVRTRCKSLSSILEDISVESAREMFVIYI